MKEFKGTKGDWEILPTSEYRKWVNVTSEKGIIARVFYGEAQPEIYKEEAEANAKLTAAAPELLQTVIELHTLLEEHLPNWYLKRHDNIVKNILKKALN